MQFLFNPLFDGLGADLRVKVFLWNTEQNTHKPGQTHKLFEAHLKTVHSLLLVGLAALSLPVLAQDSPHAMEKASVSASNSEDFLIVAGQSIGQIKIGDSSAKVHQTLGNPSFVAINGPLGSEWESYDQELEISYSRSKVAAISTTSNKYKTAAGISVGSNPDVVRKAFQGGVLTKVSHSVYIYTAAKPGIKFQFGNNVQPRLKHPLFNNVKRSTKECYEIIVTGPKP